MSRRGLGWSVGNLDEPSWTWTERRELGRSVGTLDEPSWTWMARRELKMGRREVRSRHGQQRRAVASSPAQAGEDRGGGLHPGCALSRRRLMRSHKPPNGKASSLQAIFYQWLTSDRWDLMEHFGTDSSGKVCLGDRKRPTPAPTRSWSPLTTLA